MTIRPQGEQADALAVVERLKLVNPPLDEMEKGEDGLLRPRGGGPLDADAEVRVVKGMLEGSNVNIVDSLVNMIDLARRFELQVKMMETSQEIDRSAQSILRPA